MILIDKGITDLITGYDSIYQADIVLRRRWRAPLLQAYSRRRQRYESELSIYHNRANEFRKRFRFGIWLSSILLILGAVAFPALILLGELGSLRGPILCFSPILILAGLNGWALLGMLWMWQKERKKPPPPPNPLGKRISEELLSEWRQCLRGSIKSKKVNEDDTGINHLIARLVPLEDNSYLLDHLSILENDQVNVLVIGTKGIWIFDVIHVNGVIRWNDGVWTRSRGVHRLQRDEQNVLAQDEQAYESVWSRKAISITALIENSLPDVISQNPKLARVRGGLVFTHPQARFVIPDGISFNWGIPKFWFEKLRTVPEVPGIDERTSLRMIEALLGRHRELTLPSQPKSMLRISEELVRKSEDKIKSWIAEE